MGGLSKVHWLMLAVIAGLGFVIWGFSSDNFEPTSGKPVLMMSVSTFQNPESVIFDQKRDRFYVSQAHFSGGAGEGSLAVVSAGGQIQDLNWVQGLNHPKGMGIVNDRLYVADVDQVSVINIETGQILATHKAAGAKFLNDVTVGPSGQVFVSDTITNRIYLVSNDGVAVWLEDERLNQPNGLLVQGDTLYVASWGAFADKSVDGLMGAEPLGTLLKVDLLTKDLTALSQEPVGNLDGLVADGEGRFLVSDWKAGRLFVMQRDGTVVRSFDMAKVLAVESAKGFADIAYHPLRGQLWAPMMLNGSVLVFSMVRPRGSY